MVPISSLSRVEIYIKDGCALCGELMRWLDEGGWRGQVSVHDVRGRPELFERFRYDVPVVAVDGQVRLKLRFSQAELKDVLGRGLGQAQ